MVSIIPGRLEKSRRGASSVGLDMTLSKIRKLRSDETFQDVLAVSDTLSGYCVSLDPRIQELAKLYSEQGEKKPEEVMAWRREAELHFWFLKELDGNERGDEACEVKKQNLENLASFCRDMISEKSPDSEMYLTTLEKVKELLQTTNFEEEFLIYSYIE